MVTQKELLAIAEALNNFRTIVFGHKVKVFTYHKNLTHEGTHFTSDRIPRQRLLLEEFEVEVVYIKVCKNMPADELSITLRNKQIKIFCN